MNILTHPIPAPTKSDIKFEIKNVSMTSLENKPFPPNFLLLKLILDFPRLAFFTFILKKLEFFKISTRKINCIPTWNIKSAYIPVRSTSFLPKRDDPFILGLRLLFKQNTTIQTLNIHSFTHQLIKIVAHFIYENIFHFSFRIRNFVIWTVRWRPRAAE